MCVIVISPNVHVRVRVRTVNRPLANATCLQASVLCQQPRGIFDGQHRINAASKLLAPVGLTEASRVMHHREPSVSLCRDFDILVEVYPVNSEKDITALYLEVRIA